MLKNILTSFSKTFGVVAIILFCGLSIFFSVIVREFENEGIKKTISYASFFENKFYDERMLLEIEKAKRPKSKDMVLVRIDDYSLQKIGQWPLSRTLWVKFLEKMKQYDAKIVAMDILFPEPSPVCGQTSPDDEFAAAISDFQSSKEGRKVVLSYTITDNTGDGHEELPDTLYEFMLDSKQSEGVELQKKYAGKYTYPIPKLLESTPGLAYISSDEDTDGVFRHYPLVSNFGGIYLPSFALLNYQLLKGHASTVEVISSSKANVVLTEKSKLGINSNGETKVRFYGQYDKFDSIPLYDVLTANEESKKMTDLFKDKIVFVASTAVGAHDLRHTPLDSKMPGVYFHMNVLQMLLSGLFYQDINESLKWSFIFMGVSVVISILVQLLGNAMFDIIIVILLSAGALVIDWFYFLPKGYELKLFFVLLCNGGLYSWNTFLNFSKTSREKKMIKGTFARYVAPSIVNEMLDNPEKLKIGGERKDITCLFSDVRDFTSISEKLTPMQLSAALNRYMGQMTDIVFETSGTLDKYIGDAIVAYWGAPIDLEGHPQKAVDAAIKMIDSLPAINDEFRSQGLPEFKIGIGLNSGECSVGNMGSDKIFSYTALGDNMNLGARLEGLSKYYGAQIIISEFTLARIDLNIVHTRKLDKVIVKGKENAVYIYEVLHSRHFLRLDSMARELYEKGYKHFMDRNFQLAAIHFEQILEKYPQDLASERLLKVSQEYIANPPAEGEDHEVTKFTTK